MLLTIILLLSLARYAPATTPTIQTSGSVVGVVLDQGGKPLEGARVLVGDRRSEHPWPLESDLALASQDHPIREAVTGLDGGFRLSGLAPGPARLVVRAENHATLRLGRVYVGAESTTVLGDIPLSQGVILGGYVENEDGFTIDEARIYSIPKRDLNRCLGVRTAALETKTNSSGSFMLDNLELGEWTWLIEAKGYATQRFEGELLRSGTHSLDNPLVLLKEKVAHGTVRSLKSVEDFSHLVVRAIPAFELEPGGYDPTLAQGYVETPVEESGEFSLPLRPHTLYFVRAQEPNQPFLADDAWSPVSLFQSDMLYPCDLEWLPSARVSFSALEVETAEPARNFTLRLQGATPSEPFLPPSDQAKHILRGVRPKSGAESFSLFVGGNGYREFQSREFKLEPKTLLDLGNVMLWQHPTLQVRVIDAETGRAIQYADVTLRQLESTTSSSRSSSATTDQAGRAVLDNFERVPVGVGVVAKGYASVALASPFELVEDELQVELTGGVEIAARILDSNGEPLCGEGVRATYMKFPESSTFADSEQLTRTVYTNTEGIALFRHLSTAEYAFDLPAWDLAAGLTVSQVLIPEPGPLRQLSFGLDARAKIEGQILEAGRPLPGAELRISGLRVRADKLGKFKLDGVDARDHTSRIHHPLRCVPREDAVDLRLGVNELEFLLPDSSIEGIVVDEDAIPVAGAEIYQDRRRWNHSPGLEQSNGLSLFQVERASFGEPVAISDDLGRFKVRGVEEALGLTLSAYSSLGLIGHVRVHQINPGSALTGITIQVERAAQLQIPARREKLESKQMLALVATFEGDAHAGCWMRTLVPYRGQAWSLIDLPPSRCKLYLVGLSPFGIIQDTLSLETLRLHAGGSTEVRIDR